MKEYIVVYIDRTNVKVFEDFEGNTLIFDDGKALFDWMKYNKEYDKLVFAVVELSEDLKQAIRNGKKFKKILEKEGG